MTIISFDYLQRFYIDFNLVPKCTDLAIILDRAVEKMEKNELLSYSFKKNEKIKTLHLDLDCILLYCQVHSTSVYIAENKRN